MIKVLLDKTLIKFILVGIVNTLFGTSVMFIAYNVLHQSYWFSSASNYVLGSILSYFLNKHFTFEQRDKNIKSIFRFIANISACYFIAYGFAKPLVAHLISSSIQTQENLSMLIGMCLFVGLNYIGQRYIVFRTEV